MVALSPGAMLGVYRVEHFLGSGSMGEVYAALDTGLQRQVAVKILSARHRDNSELRARFVREGRAVAAISHAHVVAVFATGLYDELPYIAMELLHGTDLGTYVEDRGPLAPAEAARVTRDAAMGLRAASQAGIIHRDVKPSNLVRLQTGEVKVTDFGLAKPKDPKREPALTGMGVVVGTPDYIAPEQARGEELDERCDIYALGGTLFFLLTARPPFRTGVASEDKYLKVVARHLRDPAPDPRAFNPAVPPALAQLCLRMMAKAPAERPSYEALISELGEIAGAGPSAPSVAAVVPGTAPRATSPDLALRPAAWGAHESHNDTYGDAAWTPLRRPIPVWMWLLTLVAIITFATGLWAYRAKHAAKPAAGATAAGEDAAIVVLGGRRVAVDRLPVTAATVARAIPTGVAPIKPEAPATNVSYTQARAYAEGVGKRLATAEELGAAANAISAPPAPLWEWVASSPEQRMVWRDATTRAVPDAARGDITFRLAWDLPLPSPTP